MRSARVVVLLALAGIVVVTSPCVLILPPPPKLAPVTVQLSSRHQAQYSIANAGCMVSSRADGARLGMTSALYRFSPRVYIALSSYGITRPQNLAGKAIAALKRALYLDPTFTPAHFALGDLLLRQGQARTARKSFENALALLSALRPDDILPESEGLTAGRFMDIVQGAIQTGARGAST